MLNLETDPGKENIMRKLWKIGLAALAVVALAGAAVGIVSAQTDGEVPGTDFVSRLAEKLGITQEELEAAIDETQLDIVDDAVADEKLTEERAAELRERIESGEGPGRFRGFGKGFAMGHAFRGDGASLDEVAELIGLTLDEIKQALEDGQSLAQVAEANGVSAEELTSTLLAGIEERVAQGVEDGKIDQAKADEILANAAERIEEMVNREGLPEKRMPRGGEGFFPGHFGHDGDPDDEADTTSA